MQAPAGQKNYLTIRGKKEAIWSWDGNAILPSLTPSYETDIPARPKFGTEHCHIHLHLTAGKVVLSSDSIGVVV